MNRLLIFASSAVLWGGSGGEVFAAEPTIEELLDATDDVNRGASSKSTITMQVKTKRYERTMTMDAADSHHCTRQGRRNHDAEGGR